MSQIRCPICERTFDSDQSQAMPFCSSRCRQIDLGRWLDEAQAIPLPPSLDEDEFPEEEM